MGRGIYAIQGYSGEKAITDNTKIKDMEIIRKNEALMNEIGRIAEVAGYLWTKGWAERNGGNISVNITTMMDEEIMKLPALAPARELTEAVPCLGGNFFYVTGTGKRMRRYF